MKKQPSPDKPHSPEPVAAPRKQPGNKPEAEKRTFVNKVQQPMRLPAQAMQPKQKAAYVADESDSSTMSLGKGGARFLKKKPTTEVTEQVTSRPKTPPAEKKKPKVNLQAASG